MIKASDLDHEQILGGIDGKNVVVTDVRPTKLGNFDALIFYVQAASKLNGTYLDAGFEAIELQESEVPVFLPDFLSKEDKQVKAVKRFNTLIGNLTNTQIDADDSETWLGVLEGGPLYEKLLNCSTAYIQCNEFGGRKNYQFNFQVSKPVKVNYNDFVKIYMAQKAKKVAALNGESAPTNENGEPAY